MKNGKLFIISGTTGAGKNTVVSEYLKNSKIPFAKIITYTTRPPRKNETDSVDYHFVSENKFDELIAKNTFLEWARVHDHKYGSPQADINQALKQGKNVILIIDVQGALAIKKIMPEAVLVFITLENFEEIKKRFVKRQGQITPELKIRLESAQNELKLAKKYNYQIINFENKLSKTVAELDKIITTEIKN